MPNGFVRERLKGLKPKDSGNSNIKVNVAGF